MTAHRFGLVTCLLLVPAAALAASNKPRQAARETAAKIDAHMERLLAEAGLEPSPVAEPGDLLRRLSLDLNGVVPTTKTALSYRRFKSQRKLEVLIEALLSSPYFDERFGALLAEAWAPLKEAADPGYRYFGPQAWLAERIRAREPVDRMAAMGLTKQRLFRSAEPARRAAQMARALMGTSIGCAECHDHPFNKWKQKDLHRLAAFFAPRGEQVMVSPSGEPRRFQPRFLFSWPMSRREKSRLNAATPLEAAAALMTAKRNPRFARTFVNRVWAAMLGRGLVEPIDDVGAQEGPQVALLEALAADFIKNGQRLRHLVRAIAYSKTYRRSTRQTEGGAELDEGARRARRALERRLYARAPIRALSPAQIAASILRVTGVEPKKPSPGSNNKGAIRRWRGYLSERRQLTERFRRTMAEDADPQAFNGSVIQTLVLFNDPRLNAAIEPRQGSMLAQVLRGKASDEVKLERLFITVLSRSPSAEERALFTAAIAEAPDTQAAWVDLMWALLNSAEFLLNH